MTTLTHAYRQAPWRVQRQIVVTVLAVVVFAAMVAALYLSVTARTAILGREIQELSAEIEDIRQENADLTIELARLRSTAEMERRARAMGFSPAEPEDLEYIFVPGYWPSGPVSFASHTSHSGAIAVPAAYTQSLFDWFLDRLQETTPAGNRTSQR
ncbi:MAG: hypothetical protein D6770_10350 [Anaerolineae bacterium]|nr:MAG: hypothetical protein D6770_10350 [Anaerolineae bacterium]